MRLLKILIIVVFIASVTNANVCSNSLFPKKDSDSGGKQLLISNLENATGALIYDPQYQAGKKNADVNSLYKIILTISAMSKLMHFGSRETANSESNRTNDYSLISLHCLLTI
jgi:hypothetical protein